MLIDFTTQKPLSTSYGDEGIKGECREGWNSPVWSICSCSFLGASWVPCVRVCDCSVGCIYALYKVNPNIFQFYFNFLDIFHHPSMHPLFRNIYEFYLIFYDFISSFIIYNNHLYLRWHFLFWFHLALDLLILSRTSCPELKSRLCMRS